MEKFKALKAYAVTIDGPEGFSRLAKPLTPHRDETIADTLERARSFICATATRKAEFAAFEVPIVKRAK